MTEPESNAPEGDDAAEPGTGDPAQETGDHEPADYALADHKSAVKSPDLIVLTIVFEFGLAAVAVVIGWLVGYRPLDWLRVAWDVNTARDLLLGLAATVPMLAGLLVIDRYPIGPLDDLKQLVEDRLVPLFARAKLWHLAIISAGAGFGEELLFRGLLQAGLADWSSGWLSPPRAQVAAVIVSSVVFGLCHWLSNTYFVLATLMGFYFAFLFWATGNLLVPMIAHGLYDFIALVYVVRFRSD